MKTRMCCFCEEEKNISKFHWKIKFKKLQSLCMDCNKIYQKEHYRQNKNYYKIKKRINQCISKLRAKRFLIGFLLSHPCVDCNESDLIVLDFDHVSGNKFKNISEMVHEGYNIDRIKEEIKKCEIRCANCHRKRHMPNRWHL